MFDETFSNAGRPARYENDLVTQTGVRCKTIFHGAPTKCAPSVRWKTKTMLVLPEKFHAEIAECAGKKSAFRIPLHASTELSTNGIKGSIDLRQSPPAP